MAGTIQNARITPFSITKQDVSGSADLQSQSMRHMFKPSTDFGLAIGATPTAVERIIYVASGAGTVEGFHGLVNAAGSAASITMDLKKNGVSILSAPIAITNATGDGVVVDGVIASPTLAAGDILSVAETVSSSTGMQGPFAWASIEEQSSPT